MSDLNSIIQDQNILFKTNRLIFRSWSFFERDEKEKKIKELQAILTPNVTKTLPKGWQKLSSVGEIEKWVEERKKEGDFFVAQLKETNQLIGCLFLYKPEETNELRLGYLLAESVWGKGIGSELIAGVVDWCQEKGIDSVIASVERDNPASMRVLEKNGFNKIEEVSFQNMIKYERKIQNVL